MTRGTIIVILFFTVILGMPGNYDNLGARSSSGGTAASTVMGVVGGEPLTSTTLPPATNTTQTPAAILQRSYLTAPPDLPAFTVERWPGELGDDYIFVSMFSNDDAVTSYNLILDNNAEPVYYEPLTTIRSSNDFKRQPNGMLTYFSPEDDYVSYAALNNNYQLVENITASQDPDTGEAYTIDNHGLQILENGNALFMIHDTRIIDMSEIAPGGSEEASVIGCIIQEVDQDNNVVFQWRSWDYIDIRDTHVPLDREPLRYMHCNSIEEDNDGNLLLGSRNLDEITKIDRQTGEIIWRMGGKKNEFNFLNDDGFSVQHDVRRLANGHITVYDNADTRIGSSSRGIEYSVDEINKTVEKVAEFRNTPETFSPFMGNMQRLPNGNTMIGWGFHSKPILTEFDNNGDKLLEFYSDERLLTYRAFRFPWEGYPTWPPVLSARLEGNTVHLSFSWNGSTETEAYSVNGARDLEHLRQWSVVKRDGFETTYSYELPEDGFWYFRARPIGKDGLIGQRSNYVFVVPGGDTLYLPIVTDQR